MAETLETGAIPVDAKRAMAASRLNLLGVPVSAFDLPGAVAEMAGAIAAGRRSYACCCPVYSPMQSAQL